MKFLHWVLIIVFVGVVGFFGYTNVVAEYERENVRAPIQEQIKATSTDTSSDKEQKIQAIMQEDSFQKEIEEIRRIKAERIYWQRKKQDAQETLNNAEQNLLDLQDKGYQGEKASAVRQLLQDENPGLAQHAERIVQLDRWVEVLAIAGAETSFCTAGVGRSKNNCGAIRSDDGGFKTYRNKLNALEDISILLKKDLYKNKTIAEMNGIYCKNEQTGGPCEGWTGKVMAYVSELNNLLI